jgi:hypothetical protein
MGETEDESAEIDGYSSRGALCLPNLAQRSLASVCVFLFTYIPYPSSDVTTAKSVNSSLLALLGDFSNSFTKTQ